MTSTPDEAPPPRPARWRRRAAVALVALLGGMAGLSWLGRSDLLSDAVAREVAPRVRTLIGLDATLGRFEIRPWRAEARVEGLALTHYAPADPTLHGAPVLSVQAAEVALGLRGWQPSLGRLEIWRPSIHLRVGPDGLRELAGLDIEFDGTGDRMPWDALLVHDGRLVVDHDKWQLRATGLTVAPAGSYRNDLTIGALTFELGDFSQTITGTRIPDILLAPGVLEVPEIDLHSEALDLGGEVRLDRGELGGQVDLTVRLAELAALTEPQVRLDGLAHLQARLGGSTGGAEVRGHLELHDLLVDRLRPDGVRVDLWFGDVSADLQLANGMLNASPIRAGWSGGQVTLHAGIDLAHRGVSLSGQARGLQLVDLLKNLSVAPTPWVALDLDLDLDAAGTLQPLRLAGSVDAVARRLRVGSAPIEDPRTPLVLGVEEGRAFAQLVLRDTTLDVDIHRFTASEGVEASVAIDAELTAPPAIDIRADIHRFPLHVLQPLGGSELQGIARGQAHLWGASGAFRAESGLEVDGMGVLGFHLADHVTGQLVSPEMKSLEFSNLSAQLGRTHYTGAIDVLLGQDPIGLDIDVVVDEGSLADLSGIVLEIPGLDAGVTGSARLAGPWNRTNGDFSLQFTDIDLFGEAFDHGHTQATMRDGELFIDQLVISRSADDSGLFGRGRLGRNYTLDLDLHAGGIDLAESDLVAATGVNINGALSADVHVTGTAFEPQPSGRIDVQRFTIGKRSLGNATVAFDTHGSRLGFEGVGFSNGVQVTGGLTLDSAARWDIEAELDGFDLAPLLPEPANGGTYVARVTGDFTGSGEFDTPAEVTASIDDVLVSWDRHQLRAPNPWRLAATGRTFQIEDVALVGGNTELRLDAQKDASGDVTLEGDGTMDLDLLRAVVPGLTRAAGTAEVAMSATGSGADFAPRAVIDIRSGLFQGTWFPHAFEGVTGHIDASQDGFVLSGGQGRLGGGRFTVGGSIDATDWMPTRIDLTTNVDGARVRYLDFLPAAVGSARLRFGGPMDALLLSGDIEIDDMVFAERIDWESWVLEFSGEHLSGAVEENTEDYFNIDLSVRGDKTIRFRNNVGDFVVSSDFQFIGSTSRPGLTGRVRVLPGGRVLLKEREFEINRAELRFTDPYAFDPDVDIDMSTEVSTREQDYDINYAVAGLYSDWRTTTRSEPALPQADINALLLFGLTMEEMERYGGAVSALAVEGGDLLASKLGIVERVGQGVVGLDTFRPERIDLVSGVSERGSGSVSSDLRLLVEKDLDWATLIFEQNLSRSIDTYLGLERRLARMFYLRTYWAREQVGRRLDIGGAYGFEANVRGELD